MNKIRRFAAFELVLALMLLTVFVPAVHAEETLGPDEAKHSVFRVVTKDASGAVISFGSTFAVGEQSPVTYLLTNYHVVSENESGVYIWMDQDKEIKCEVAMALTDRDLAILKLETPVEAEPLPLGTEDMVKTGDDVYALGYPTNDISNTLTSYPEDVTVTKGIISKTANWNGVRYYQIDAAINQGNSGGPLLHKNGYVVGVASMKMNDTEGINGAIRIEEALDALDSLGIRVKMAVPTVAGTTQTPEQTESATPEPSTTPEVTATPEAQPARRTSAWGVFWLVVFILAALSFAGVLGYMFVKRRGGVSSLKQSFLPKKEQGYIIGIKGTYAGAVIALNGETVFFGRDPQRCQLVFDEKDDTVSRVHCSVRYDAERDCFTLENYSGNGTFLADGRRLEDGDAADLHSGDRFYLVDQHILFEVNDQAPERG